VRLRRTNNNLKEALINSSVNDQSTKKIKCDFAFFFIFNGLPAIEYGSTFLCCGNSELIRVSLSFISVHLFHRIHTLHSCGAAQGAFKMRLTY